MFSVRLNICFLTVVYSVVYRVLCSFIVRLYCCLNDRDEKYDTGQNWRLIMTHMTPGARERNSRYMTVALSIIVRLVGQTIHFALPIFLNCIS